MFLSLNFINELAVALDVPVDELIEEIKVDVAPSISNESNAIAS
jgi:hypothetical protein